MIITLCGSTRFKREFFNWAKRLTYEGHIVLMPFIFGHCGDAVTDKTKEMLDKLHLDKIKMSNEIHVICPDHYIEESTSREIAYAKKQGIKIVKYFVPHCFGTWEPEDTSWCCCCKYANDCYATEMNEEHG